MKTLHECASSQQPRIDEIEELSSGDTQSDFNRNLEIEPNRDLADQQRLRLGSRGPGKPVMNEVATKRHESWPDSLALYHAARRGRARAMSDMIVAAARRVVVRFDRIAVFVRAPRGDLRVPRLNAGRIIRSIGAGPA